MENAHYFEREFEIRFLKSRGAAFQDLFADLMERAYPGDFQRIRPHGNSGDLKCDGYLISQRVVFQVYGPDDIRRLDRLLQKVRDDFNGALKHWADRMERWVFVHNSQAGLPAQAVQLVDDLGKQPGAPNIEIWGYERLRQVLHQIGKDALPTLFTATLAATFGLSDTALPKPSTITRFWEQYWKWLESGNYLSVTPPHLAVLQTIDLPFRLTLPHLLRELRALGDGPLTQGRKDTPSGKFKGSYPFEVRFGETDTNLIHLLRTHHRLLIVGESGSGKSTLLQGIAKYLAHRLRKHGIAVNRRQTPVLVELWQFGANRTLLDLIAGSIKRGGVNVSESELLVALEQGYVMLLLDGLDDVPQEHRRECLAQLLALVDRYPRLRTLLTSRPFPEPPDKFDRLEIAPLSDADIANALHVRFGSVGAFRKRFNDHTPEGYVSHVLHPYVRDLCRRPLTLGLVLTLMEEEGGLPDSLYQVYDRFMSLLLDWEVRSRRLLSTAVATAILDEIAYIMMSSDQPHVSSVEWLRTAGQTITHLGTAGISKGASAEEIFWVLLSTGMISDLGGKVTFSHKSFPAFLAARRSISTLADPYSDPVSKRSDVAQFLISYPRKAAQLPKENIAISKIHSVAPLLEEHLLSCDDVRSLWPLLKEASYAGHDGGRFEALYRAISFGEEVGIELTYSRMTEEEEQALSDSFEELIQTCIAFKPKALSLLKLAADGIARAVPWDRSRLWFEQVVEGLEVYGWPGAKLHRRFAEAGFFENIDVFSDDGFSRSKATERVEEFEKYFDTIYHDDFTSAARHLANIENALIESRPEVSYPSKDDRTLELPFPDQELN